MFTTDALPERGGFAAYREEFAIPFGGVEVSRVGDGALRVSVSVNQFSALTCAKFNSSPTQFERSRRLLQDGDDSIYVLLTTFGSLRVWQREVHSDLRLGDAAVVVNGEQRGGIVDGEGLGVRIPHPPLMSLLPRAADFAPVTLSRDAAATKLLLSYLVSLVDFPPGHVAGIDEVTSRHVVDLLALAIGPSPDARERVAQGGVRAARLRTIMADVRAGIGTRDLSVTAIASQHRISARYVQMLFEAEGTTYSEFVLGERLAKAAQLLADPAHLSLRISGVAYKVGFSDLSYFNRASRRRYGATPSEVRGRR